MLSTFPTATITGYTHLGPNCEQTNALKDYWAGRLDAEAFSQSMHSLRLNTYSRLRELGLGEDYSIPASYTHYDHVLDTALSVGLVASEPTGTDFDVDEYFAVARGMEHQVPFVPELEDSTRFRARPQHLLSLVAEAKAASHTIRPVLIGPVTLLALAKTSPGTSTSAFERLDELITAYDEVISLIPAAGV
ncbi:MAG: 5-methyltetrahydropteroyltriglutamate--homocysteine S-methyltransferase, partial [Brevibacterium aurantiacum]